MSNDPWATVGHGRYALAPSATQEQVQAMKKDIDPADFRVPEGVTVELDKWPTDVQPFYKSKANYRKISRKTNTIRVSSLQSQRYPLLYCFF